MLTRLLNRLMLFDEDDGGGGGEVDLTSKEIGDELNAMLGDIEGTATPILKDADDIDLDLNMEGDDPKPEPEPEPAPEPVADPEPEPEPAAAKEPEPKKGEGEADKVDDVESMRADFNKFASAQLEKFGISEEGRLVQQDEPPKPEPAPAEPAAPKAVEVKPIELTDEAFEELKEDKEKFTKFINDIGVNIASAVQEKVLLNVIPSTQKYASNYISSVQTVENFYRENPELNDYRSVVGFLSTKIGQENPEMNRGDLLKKTGEEAYRLLRIKRGTNPPNNGAPGKTKPPAFGETGTRRSKPGEKVYKNKISKELAEMAPR
ncbi:MAG: hypothetical protein ACXABY_22665 [Candidatus Thorarchaeota archaeon]